MPRRVRRPCRPSWGSSIPDFWEMPAQAGFPGCILIAEQLVGAFSESEQLGQLPERELRRQPEQQRQRQQFQWRGSRILFMDGSVTALRRTRMNGQKEEASLPLRRINHGSRRRWANAACMGARPCPSVLSCPAARGGLIRQGLRCQGCLRGPMRTPPPSGGQSDREEAWL